MKDGQRQAVYDWQSELSARYLRLIEDLPTLQECAALIAQVWDDYRPGSNYPLLADGRGTRLARGSRWKISLPAWARTRKTVLHEIAHSLTTDGPAHGREFARLLMELFERYAGVPLSEARRLGVEQRPRRVHFAPLAASPKPVTRAWKAWKTERDRLTETLKRHGPEPRRYPR